MGNKFDLEAAKRGEPVERICGTVWESAGFVAMWDDVMAVCRVRQSSWPELIPLDCLRMAPKKVTVRYRVSLCRYGPEFYPYLAQTDHDARKLESNSEFVRWLTDWQEAEISG